MCVAQARAGRLLGVTAAVAIFGLWHPGTLAIETQINKLVYNYNGIRGYSFELETSDGTYRREDGGLVSNLEDEGLVVRGEYGYTDPAGRRHSVRYVADRNGYRPQYDELTSEDIELRRLFPSEFPQDTIRRSGSQDPEHLGRYNELKHYFKYPKTRLNSHFEELACYIEGKKKVCRIDKERYSPEEDSYYYSAQLESHTDRRRVYCFMLLCFTEDELDRVVSSF